MTALSRTAAIGLAASVVLLLLALSAAPASAFRQMSVRATVVDHYPEPNTAVTVRVKAVDQRGRALRGVQCVTTWYLPSATRRRIMVTDGSGIASFKRYVGDGLSGSRVRVTVRSTWRGQTRRSGTWFVPLASLPAVPRIVFIGDSLTIGLYAVNEADSFRRLVAAHVDCPAVLLAGVGGQSKDVDLSSVSAAAGDIVVIELGTNDAVGYPELVPVPPAVFAANLRAIARAARAGAPDCRLIFLSVWQQMPLRAPYDEIIAAVAAMYGRHFVDLSAIKDDWRNSWPTKGEATFIPFYEGPSDGWHPNNAGHAAIADAVDTAIDRLLGRNQQLSARLTAAD